MYYNSNSNNVLLFVWGGEKTLGLSIFDKMCLALLTREPLNSQNVKGFLTNKAATIRAKAPRGWSPGPSIEISGVPVRNILAIFYPPLK